MILKASLFITALCCSFSSFADHEKSEPSDGTVASFIDVSPPSYLTPVNFFDHDGNAVNFSDFQGKVLLVNLWATWCGPCLRELPALQRLSNKLAGTDFKLLAISIDKEKSNQEIFSFYEKLNITSLGLYIDNEQNLGEVLPTDVVPASFIINRHGQVVSYMRSFADWDSKEATDFMLSHIASVPYLRPEIVTNTD